MRKTFAYILALEMETDKVWKTKYKMVYCIDLSGLLRRTLTYIHASMIETSKVWKT